MACIFAVYTHTLLHLQGGVPDKPTFRICDRIGAIVRIAAAGIAWPETVGRLIRLCHPLVAVTAVAARRVKIVEQHELICEAALIRHNVFPEHPECWIAI